MCGTGYMYDHRREGGTCECRKLRKRTTEHVCLQKQHGQLNNAQHDSGHSSENKSINQLTGLYVHQQTIATQKICAQKWDSHLFNHSIDSA